MGINALTTLSSLVLSFVFLFGNSNTLFASIKASGQNYFSGKVESMEVEDEKLAVVVFLSATCPCSDSHVEHLNNLSAKYPKIKFYGFHSNQDQNSKLGLEYFQKKKMKFPVWRDEKAKVADKLGALKTPHVFILKNEEVLYSGPVSDKSNFSKSERHYLEEFLVANAAGTKFEAPTKRPLGCYIAR